MTSKFSSKTPHFFKVILHETIRDGKLGIPRKFVRKHGKLLPSTIQLEVPSGANWHVELTKCDEGETVWLQKGWKEFAERYSLKHGHFVVFRYEGNARFHVLIFDTTASEIEYPYCNTEDDIPVNVGLCYDVSEGRKSKEKTDLTSLQPQKKIRTTSPDQPGIDVGGNIAVPRSVKTEFLSCAQRFTAAEKARAVQTASAFKCTGNPSFMVIMQPSFVGKKYRMVIPIHFARKYLTSRNGNLTLCDSTGHTWPAIYCICSRGKKQTTYMHGGWRAFAEDNNLVAGDICVFELIKHLEEIVLKVVIYPVVQNASKACRPPADGSKSIGNRVKIRKSVGDTEPNCRQTRCSSSSRKCKKPKIEEDEILEVSDDDSPVNLETKKDLTNPSVGIQANGIKIEKQNKCEFKHSAKGEKERATNFNSANPSFTIMIHPSYVVSWFTANIPYKFAKKYLEENGEVTLRVSDGRAWIVEYKVCSGRARFDINSWKAFAVDNRLKVGDICVFELVKENGFLFDVVILPAAS